MESLSCFKLHLIAALQKNGTRTQLRPEADHSPPRLLQCALAELILSSRQKEGSHASLIAAAWGLSCCFPVSDTETERTSSCTDTRKAASPVGGDIFPLQYSCESLAAVAAWRGDGLAVASSAFSLAPQQRMTKAYACWLHVGGICYTLLLMRR
jgi:hypothetical protein